jgi:uncharacterized membrane protein YtjA (UPF0391 family)
MIRVWPCWPAGESKPAHEGAAMLHYAIVFLVIAIIAAILGFGGIAKILFVIFLILAIIAFFRRAS